MTFHARDSCVCRPMFFIMEWIDKVNRIVVLNLLHREDRLLDFTKQAEEYQIPFDRINAIHDKQAGARGLRDTMLNLFKEEIAKGTEHLLVFEDDAELVTESHIFHTTMNKVVEQVPENYHMVFLGCQITANGCKWFSENLIRVVKAFSTHAVLYSLQGMKEVASRDFGYPIDNWYVAELQNAGHSYCTYPFLASQRDGVSDIGGNFISWKPFLEQRFKQKFGEIRR